MIEQTFETTILSGTTKNVAGIEVPAAVIVALGAGQRPRLAVDVNGYRYATTVGKMGDKHLIPLSADHRRAAGLSGGDRVTVGVSLAGPEQAPAIPDELQQALSDAGLTAVFESAAPSRRKEWIRQVVEAKAADTRARRIDKIVRLLQLGD